MSIDHLYSTSKSTTAATTVKTMGTVMFGAALIAGTGGVYSLENAKNWLSHPYIEHRLSSSFGIEILSETVALAPIAIDVRTILEHIQNIKNVFEIPISNIADILDVSRQAIYKWLANTSVPEQNKQELIKKFSHVADKFKEIEINRSGALLKMKAFEGRSLSDILSAGEDPSSYVAILINEAKIMESSYKKSGLSKSKAKPTNEWRSHISIPGFPEKK